MERNTRYGCMSMFGVLLMLVGTLIIAGPVQAADSVEFTVELIDYETEEFFTQGKLVITDLDKDTTLELENDGTGSFDVDTSDLPDFEYGDLVTIEVTNLESTYRSCYLRFNLFDNWYDSTLIVNVYRLLPSYGKLIVGDMAANGAGGSIQWKDSNPTLGTLVYDVYGSAKISATYSWHAPAAPSGYGYRYEWYFHIKVTKSGFTPMTNTHAVSKVVYTQSKSGDPLISVVMSQGVHGIGTCIVEIWFDYYKYQIYPGAETLLDSGSIYPSPATKLLTLA